MGPTIQADDAAFAERNQFTAPWGCWDACRAHEWLQKLEDYGKSMEKTRKSMENMEKLRENYGTSMEQQWHINSWRRIWKKMEKLWEHDLIIRHEHAPATSLERTKYMNM